MIYTTLHYVTQQLNEHLKLQFSLSSNKAILASLTDEGGMIPAHNKDKIILSLVNLAHETPPAYGIKQQYAGQKGIQQNQPYLLNLDLLVTAYCHDYGEALRLLSESMYFFQAKPLFTPENSPGLDERVQRLSLEMMKMDYGEVQNLWTALGTSYLPSVLFKVRIMAVEKDRIQPIVPIVGKSNLDVKPES